MTYRRLVLIPCVLLLSLTLAQAQTNLLKNASFEELGDNGFPVAWGAHCTGGATAGAITEGAPVGQNAAFIKKVIDGASHVAAIHQFVPTEPKTEYLLSAMAKGDGLLFLYEYDANQKYLRNRNGVRVSSESWMPIEAFIKTSDDARYCDIRFEIYGKEREGQGWVDNIFFGRTPERLGPPENIACQFNQDTRQISLTWSHAQLADVSAFCIYRSRFPDVGVITVRSQFPNVGVSTAPHAIVKDCSWTDLDVPADWPRAFYSVVALSTSTNQLGHLPEPAEVSLLPPGPAAAPVVWTTSTMDKVRHYQAPPTARPQSINLVMAQNETESSQVAVHAAGGPIQQLNATCSTPCRRDTGAAEPRLSPAILQVCYTQVARPRVPGADPGLWPDPLPPWRGPVDVPFDATQSIWFQFTATPDCPPGDYTATATLTSESGLNVNIPISITVFDFALPTTPSYQSAFLIWENHLAKAFGLKLGTPEFRALHEKFYWFMADRRLLPSRLPFPVTDPEAVRFLNDPRVNSVSLPGGWLKVNVPVLKAAADRLRELNWLDKAYVYCFDEPNRKQYQECRELGEAIHQVGADIPVLLTEQPEPELYGAIDIWCPILDACKWDVIAERRAAGDKVWWYTCIWPPPPYPTYWVDDIGIAHRILSWLQAYHDIRGVLYWNVVYWHKKDENGQLLPTNVWNDAEVYPRGNGEGFLLYPGNHIGIDGPVSSVRLEILRDGNEDFEYFELLRQRLTAKGASAAEIEAKIRTFVTPLASNLKEWGRDPEALLQQRRQLAEAILQLK